MTAKEMYEKLTNGEINDDDINRMLDNSKRRYREMFGEDVPSIGGWGFIGKYIEVVDRAIETGTPLEEAPKTINGLEVKY